jgi:glycosyltransferase involved in cell wall biosynthesis
MKIVMFSINPVFPDVVTGGASKHLYHIAKYLGCQGHQVEMLCARPEMEQASFMWSDNVFVKPILPFHQPFPQPYAVSGGEIAVVLRHIAEHLGSADRFYVHDGEFLLPDAYRDIPTVASFRDNIYPESVLGSFIGKFDDVVCVSQFSYDVIASSAGLFYPDLLERLHLVNNGLDFEVFLPRDPQPLADAYGIDPERHHVILHPHRPEPGKGLPETIQVVYRLVNEHGMSGVKVLIPAWIDSMTSNSDSSFYESMIALMADLGIRDNFQFISWLPNDRMPELYSLGQVTLCLGSIVEAFGNVAYESIACGTPSVVARVGVHRTMLPDGMIYKVDYGDVESAVEIVRDVIQTHQKPDSAVMTLMRSKMNFQHQVSSYADLICNCEKRPLMDYRAPDFSGIEQYRLPPWCYLSEDRVYHDFKGEYGEFPNLVSLAQSGNSFTTSEAKALGVEETEWQAWLDGTWIVPDLKQ